MKFVGCLLTLTLSLNALSQIKVKVLTYNIYHGEMAYEAGKPSLDSIAAFINKVHPDFVVLQEVDSATGRSATIYGKKIDLVKELGAKTGMNAYFGKSMDYDGGGYGEGLLSMTPLKTNVAILPSPAGGEPRSLIYTNTRLSNGQNIIVGGTHLCHEFPENRTAQAESIDKLYRSLLVPGIVCGDFNFESTDPTYEIMTNYFKDAAMVRKLVPATFSSRNPSKRIDYAFITKRGNWKVINAEVFPVNYSDHLPVLFTFEMTINE
jgi:endonuclease/exonuclease/phosphatase family metal-dependent hydrolase